MLDSPMGTDTMTLHQTVVHGIEQYIQKSDRVGFITGTQWYLYLRQQNSVLHHIKRLKKNPDQCGSTCWAQSHNVKGPWFNSLLGTWNWATRAWVAGSVPNWSVYEGESINVSHIALPPSPSLKRNK